MYKPAYGRGTGYTSGVSNYVQSSIPSDQYESSALPVQESWYSGKDPYMTHNPTQESQQTNKAVAVSSLHMTNGSDNLAEALKKYSISALHIAIRRANRHLEPLPLTAQLDTQSDANFISLNRVNELGYAYETLRKYEGRAVRTLCECGGTVKPEKRIDLQWHDLDSASKDYWDEFLVLETDEIGLVVGLDTIAKRDILRKGPKFYKSYFTSNKTEKKLKQKSTTRRGGESAELRDGMRRELIAGQSGQSSQMGSSQSTGWSEWEWIEDKQKHRCWRIDEQGETVFAWHPPDP